MSPSSSSRGRARTALRISAAHVALGLVVQAEEYLQFLRRPGDGLLRAVSFFLYLPFRQLEWVLVAAVLGAGWVAWPRGAWGRRAYVALLASVNFYVALDPIAYRFFFDHLRPSAYEGSLRSIGALADSLRVAIDAVIAGNVILAALATGAIARWTARPEVLARAAPWRFARPAIALAALYVLASVTLGRAETDDNLDRHPLVTLALDLTHAERRELHLGAGERQLYAPRNGVSSETDAERRALEAATQPLRRSGRKRNVVMVILESIGAKQLTPLLDAPADAQSPVPHLAALLPRSVLFDTVYDLSPTTIRTHLPVNTGGRSVTSSSLFTVLGQRYAGPSLVGTFRNAGYRTALFSAGDLDFAGLGRFYGSLGYDAVFDFGTAPAPFRKAHQVNSWGGDEDAVRERAIAWLDGGATTAPFFLQFLTVTTHHPYDVPGGYHGPRAPDTPFAKYLDALSYADRVIGRLVEDLKERGLLEDTLLVITGDHGEAFGDFHRKNTGHADLFEEDVRTFLWVVDLSPSRAGESAAQAGVRSHRIGSVGDEMPTVLALAGLPPVDVPGQDLSSASYAPRIVYFYKSGGPGTWGLRDGRWKYIGRSEGKPELYDLDADPGELRNLRDERPDLVESYERLCASWYVALDADFARSQTGAAGQSPSSLTASAEESRQPTLVGLTVGAERENGLFLQADAINPWDKIVARTTWEVAPSDAGVHFVWTRPSGTRLGSTTRVTTGVFQHLMPLQDPLPHETGSWTVRVLEGEHELASRAFQVDATAAMTVPLSDRFGALATVEVNDATARPDAGRLSSGAALVVVTTGARPRSPYKIWCVWTPPSRDEIWAQDVYWPQQIGAEGERARWTGCHLASATVSGGWTVRVLTADRTTRLGSASFRVE